MLLQIFFTPLYSISVENAIFWYLKITELCRWQMTENHQIWKKLWTNMAFHNTTTYNSRVTQKKWHKKTNAIFSSLGKNGIVPWHFFQILSWAFRVIWGWISKKVEFWDLNAEVWYLLKMYGFSPRKGKAALCATYGSKVMI